MIDLTPLDVRKKRGDFRRNLRGYDPEEVDTFMDLVAERFEELVRENLALSEKTTLIENQLKALEGREHAVQEALVSAQKLREEVKDQSRRDADVLQDQAVRGAELLKSEAEAEIARRLGEAEGLIRERQRALEELERSRLKFLKAFRGLLERELDAVEVEGARRPLEDITLDLDFRGWEPEGSSEEEEDVEEEAGEEAQLEAEDDGGDEDWEVQEEEKEDEVEAEGLGPESETMERGSGISDVAGQEEGPWEVVEVLEADDGPGIPGGFETQVLDGAVPTVLSVLPEEEAAVQAEDQAPVQAEDKAASGQEEAGVAPAEEGEAASSTREPKWLFSLLKNEEEQGG